MVVPANNNNKQNKHKCDWFRVGVGVVIAIMFVSIITLPYTLPTTTTTIKTFNNKDKDKQSVATPCQNAVDHLLALNIKMVALDFDLTIVDIHTGGHWTKDAILLADHVRPQMQCFIATCLLHSQSIKVSIVTFSSQTSMIRDVLQLVFSPPPQSNNDNSNNGISIFGGRNLSEPQGKRQQLQLARQEQEQEQEHEYKPGGGSGNVVVVSPFDTLLIDDDRNNIDKAIQEGYKAVWFDPDHAELFFETILAI